MEKLLYALLIALASLTAFSGLRNAEAVWDERHLLSSGGGDSAAEASLATRLKEVWKPLRSKRYSPMAPTVEAVVQKLGPTHLSKTQISHGLNFSLHVMNSILVLLLLSLVLGSSGAAFWGALLFALHPLQVESIATAAALPYVLGTWFALIALWQFFVFHMQDDRRRDQSRTPIIVASSAFIAALLTTPAAVVTPLLGFILLQVRPTRSSLLASRASPWPLVLWLMLGILPLVWAFRAQETSALASQIPIWARPFIAGDALTFYLSKLIAPLFLGPDYGRSPAYVLSHWWGYLTFAIPLTLLIVIGFFRDLRQYYFAALGLFILGLLPFLGLVLFPDQATSTVADSFAYLALLGPALALAATFIEVRSGWLPTLTLLALGALGFASFRQVGHWRSNESLWNYAVTVNPLSPKVHAALADAAMEKGQWKVAKGHYEQVLAVNKIDSRVYFQLGTIESAHGSDARAIELFEQALQLNPTLVEAHGRLGLSYYEQQKWEQALVHFRKATTLAPDHPVYLRYLGMLSVERGLYAEGLPFLQKALELSADNQAKEKARVHALMGLALARTNQAEAAQQHLEKALALDPQQADAHRLLADIYYDQKRWQDARSHYQIALLSQSKDPELHRRLGEIRLQSKQYDKAIASLSEALRLRADWPEVLSSLGTAYYHLRRFPEAIATLRRSLDLKPQQAEPHYVLGEIGRWQGPDSVAANAYNQALKIDPDHIEARFRLGNWNLKKNRFAEAARQYKAALRLAPSDARLITQLRKAERGEPDATLRDAAASR